MHLYNKSSRKRNGVPIQLVMRFCECVRCFVFVLNLCHFQPNLLYPPSYAIYGHITPLVLLSEIYGKKTVQLKFLGIALNRLKQDTRDYLRSIFPERKGGGGGGGRGSRNGSDRIGVEAKACASFMDTLLRWFYSQIYMGKKQCN